MASSIPAGRLRSVCTGCFRYQHQAPGPNTRNQRCNTQYTLHCAVRPPLHRPPAPTFHCGPAPRSETACLSSLGSSPRFARRVRHIVLPALLHPLRYGRSPRPRAEAHGQGCGLRAFTALLPEYRHPKEPAAPTVCVSAASSGGPVAFAESLTLPLRHLPNEIRRWYP